jgi:hypothetical protein
MGRRTSSRVLVLLAAVFPALPLAAQEATCRALLKGERLTTTLEVGKGYRLQAAWNVLGYVRPHDSNDPDEIAADLELVTITETDLATKKRQTIRPPEPVRVQAVADNPVDALQRATDSWCDTVGRALTAGVRASAGLLALRAGRIT